MTTYPTQLKLDGEQHLLIDWSDGTKRRYSPEELRDKCPCATCRERRSGKSQAPEPGALPVLAAAEAQPTRITSMKPVGNYAYSIAFIDGHNSGIFTFELLRELGEAVG